MNRPARAATDYTPDYHRGDRIQLIHWIWVRGERIPEVIEGRYEGRDATRILINTGTRWIFLDRSEWMVCEA